MEVFLSLGHLQMHLWNLVFRHRLLQDPKIFLLSLNIKDIRDFFGSVDRDTDIIGSQHICHE